MSLFAKPLDSVDQRDLQALLDARTPESEYIEYKREPYGHSDPQKKEFLKDVSSFANTSGGVLLIGIRAEKGLPVEISPIPAEKIDAELLRMENLVRAGLEPSLTGIRMRGVPTGPDTGVILVRIPRSWNLPHRVSAKGTNRYYLRSSAGAHEASVDELRMLFTASADIERRVRRFRERRVALISLNQGPIDIVGNGRVILHLVPLASAASWNVARWDMEEAVDAHKLFYPIDGDGDVRPNLEGMVVQRYGSPCSAYTQLFRNGIVEAAAGNLLHEHEGQVLVSPSKLLEPMLWSVRHYMWGLEVLNVPCPVVAMISLEGVRGAQLAPSEAYNGDGVPPFRMSEILLPEVMLQTYGEKIPDYHKPLKPIFEALWNAAGYFTCPEWEALSKWDPEDHG